MSGFEAQMPEVPPGFKPLQKLNNPPKSNTTRLSFSAQPANPLPVKPESTSQLDTDMGSDLGLPSQFQETPSPRNRPTDPKRRKISAATEGIGSNKFPNRKAETHQKNSPPLMVARKKGKKQQEGIRQSQRLAARQTQQKVSTKMQQQDVLELPTNLQKHDSQTKGTAGNDYPNVSGTPAILVPQLHESTVFHGNEVSGKIDRERDSQWINTASRNVESSFHDKEDGAPLVDDLRLRVGSYRVKSELSPILVSILDKHGDIAKDSILESKDLLNAVLESICKAVKELKDIPRIDVGDENLNVWYAIVSDAEKVKVDVSWLRKHLDTISRSLKSIHAFEKLMIFKNKSEKALDFFKKSLELKKVELNRIQSEMEKVLTEIQAVEDQLKYLTSLTDKMNGAINGLMCGCELLLKNSLADGLV